MIVGIGTAAGVAALPRLPGLLGWAALPVILALGYALARPLRPVAPIAGTVRTPVGSSYWVVLSVGGAAGLWAFRPGPIDGALLPIGAGIAAGLADRERAGSAAADARPLSGALGLIGVFLGAGALIELAAPGTVLTAAAGGVAALLTLDQVPPDRLAVRRPIYATVAGLILAQLGLLLAFLPLAPWAEAALLMLLTYTWVGALALAAARRLTSRQVREHALILIGGAILLGVFGR